MSPESKSPETKHNVHNSAIWFFQPSWFHFYFFLIVNILMSHISPPQPINWCIALCLIIFPFLYGLKQISDNEKQKDWDWSISFPPLSSWSILLLVFLAFFLRFYRLTSIVTWPSFDEAMFGYLAQDLSKGWHFKFFYGIGQIPPMFIWFLAAIFKVFGISLSSLWLAPAILSAATLPLVFFTALKFFGRSTAYFLVFLWSFSFWPLYEGRYCVQYALYMFWIWLTLLILGIFIRATSQLSLFGSIIALSVATGLGFYVSTGWPLVALAITSSLLYFTKTRIKFFITYSSITSILGLPLVVLFFRKEYGLYIHNLWAFDKGGDLSSHFSNSYLYLSGLFWGIPKEYMVSSYGPAWGGMLNCILGAFFFVGLMCLFRNINRTWAKFCVAFLPLLFIPAFLTKDLEFFRVFQILPLLFFVIFLGFQHLLNNSPTRKKQIAILVCLALSVSLDVYHLYGPCVKTAMSESAWPYKDNRRYQSFHILNNIQRAAGPGLIFDKFQSIIQTGMTQKYSDQSLSIAAYSFNALDNHSISMKDVRWVAVICDAPYQTYLTKIFPDGIWYPVSSTPDNWDQTAMLEIIPYSKKYRNIFNYWIAADQGYRQVVKEMLDHVDGQSNEPIYRSLFKMYPLVQGNPFLEAGFWNKIARFNLRLDAPFIVNSNILNLYKPNDFSLDPDHYHLAYIYGCTGLAWFLASSRPCSFRLCSAWFGGSTSSEFGPIAGRGRVTGRSKHRQLRSAVMIVADLAATGFATLPLVHEVGKNHPSLDATFHRWPADSVVSGAGRENPCATGLGRIDHADAPPAIRRT